MLCPHCRKEDSQVIDSRDVDESTIRRRRACPKCRYRFTTYEKIEPLKLTVIKRDDRLEPYRREKLERGIRIACQKRIPDEQIDNLIDVIEQELIITGTDEIPSRKIGDLVISKLKEIDEIAYLRFTSVYKGFKSLKSFEKELKKLKT